MVLSDIGCFTYIYATNCICQTSGEFIGEELLYMYDNGSCNEEDPGDGDGGGGGDEEDDDEESGCPDGMIDSYCGCVWDISECETEEETKTYYEDNDNDGWGNTENPQQATSQPSGWVIKSGDYNDDCKDFENKSDQCTPCNPTDLPANFERVNSTHNLAGNEGGWTQEENVEIDIIACLVNNEWIASLSSLTGKISVITRLLSGISEVTGTNTIQANWAMQVYDLNRTSRFWGSWYMLSAIEAHEEVHANTMETGLNEVSNDIKALVAALKVPNTGQTEAQAISAIKALPGYGGLITDAMDLWTEELQLILKEDHGLTFTGPAYNAELGVTQPMVSIICNKVFINQWGQVCP